MLPLRFKLTGNGGFTYDTSTSHTFLALLRPSSRAAAAATARSSCTAEQQRQPQPPIAAAAAAADQAGTDASNSVSEAAAGPAAGLQLPAAPQLLGASPQGRWNAVSLAFLGDAVWEAMLRGHCYDPANMRQYGARVAAMVTTQAQAAVYQLLVSEGWLSDEEASLMRWATNSASVAPPSHATRQQYKQATAVEALVAHLYLTDAARLQQLVQWLLQPQRLKQWQQPLRAQVQQPANATRKSSSSRQARSSTKHGSDGSRTNSNNGGSSTHVPAGVDAGTSGRRARRTSRQRTEGA